jgi:hypothetical protein
MIQFAVIAEKSLLKVFPFIAKTGGNALADRMV